MCLEARRMPTVEAADRRSALGRFAVTPCSDGYFHGIISARIVPTRSACIKTAKLYKKLQAPWVKTPNFAYAHWVKTPNFALFGYHDLFPFRSALRPDQKLAHSCSAFEAANGSS